MEMGSDPSSVVAVEIRNDLSGTTLSKLSKPITLAHNDRYNDVLIKSLREVQSEVNDALTKLIETTKKVAENADAADDNASDDEDERIDDDPAGSDDPDSTHCSGYKALEPHKRPKRTNPSSPNKKKRCN
ncbi:hypothetical protein B566_EDAN014379 [Ephemera danica]|nr:hypothetical protein B566_EDAN014379 [Ephemera danica]